VSYDGIRRDTKLGRFSHQSCIQNEEIASQPDIYMFLSFVQRTPTTLALQHNSVCWVVTRVWSGGCIQPFRRNVMPAILKRYMFNLLTPNVNYSGRTAPLTSKRCILYIYSTNIGTEYFKHGICFPFFSLQNAVCFIILTYLVPVLFTFYIQGVLKLKK